MPPMSRAARVASADWSRGSDRPSGSRWEKTIAGRLRKTSGPCSTRLGSLQFIRNRAEVSHLKTENVRPCGSAELKRFSYDA